MSSNYTIALENWRETYPEMEPLYRKHYDEMTMRQSNDGITVSPYKLRLDEYFKASDGGWLFNTVARFNGVPVGYCNFYITNDMHNHDLIAQEDALYVLKEHRNGIGGKLVKYGLEELKKRNVKRLHVSAVIDPRVGLLWKRMGFKSNGEQLIYSF